MTKEILQTLRKKSDAKYRDFNAKIVATGQEVLGVRMGELRKIARTIAHDEEVLRAYAQADKEGVYELVMLEGLALSYSKTPFCKMRESWEAYFEKVDSWAQIDSPILSLTFADESDKACAWRVARVWSKSRSEFVTRAGLVMLLAHFVERNRLEEIFAISARIKTRAKYVVLANAWLVSVMMPKFPRETLAFLRKNLLDAKTHNLAIQKSRESFRVSREDKEKLRALQVKA